MANPTTLKWQFEKLYTDGSAFGQADFAGFEISVNDQPSVAIPAAWNDSGTYSFPLASLALGYGTFKIAMYTVAKNGLKSAASNSLTFTIADTRVPKAPFGLSAA